MLITVGRFNYKTLDQGDSGFFVSSKKVKEAEEILNEISRVNQKEGFSFQDLESVLTESENFSCVKMSV